MKTEQINIRLRPDLAAALDRVAREEALDRGTAIRRLLETSIRRWELERALQGYQRGELSLGRAAEESGLTQWELIDAARAAGIAYPLDAQDVERRLHHVSGRVRPEVSRTLPDIPPRPGGVLLVGINPAPPSVAAGHYYQGRIGQRLWRRLERLGLLKAPVPGAEDEAFARAGHGLTDLVKRPTVSSAELEEAELREGADELRQKINQWQPGLILFAFKEPARRLLGDVKPGTCAPFEDVPTFLLSGPYASRAETERIDEELSAILGRQPRTSELSNVEQTQRITAHDRSRGQIRFPRPAKRFFPQEKAPVEVVLRGRRAKGRYDPRLGPDRERSAVLALEKTLLRELVGEDEVLQVSRGIGGVVRLD
jgi:hypothetical protein